MPTDLAQRFQKLALVALGLVAVALAILGAILPGLPTVPFVLLALWAFARSSPRLHAWLRRMPLLQTALREADRFSERRAMRMRVKLFALVMAWLSVAMTTWLADFTFTPVVIVVATAAIAATIFTIWIPTDRDPS